MQILVTGGAGFIGSHLIEACLTLGHDVTAVDNFSLGRQEQLAHLAGRPQFTLHAVDTCWMHRVWPSDGEPSLRLRVPPGG